MIRRILGSASDIPVVKFLFELFFVILPIAFLIRTFFFGLYQVPTGSMETTLLVGERFFADKLTYWFRAPKRGEIVAFDEPRYPYSSNPVANLWQRYVSWNVSNWTKRVIGIPGDHVKGVIEGNKTVVYLKKGGEPEFKKLDEESYVNKYPIVAVYTNADRVNELGLRERDHSYKSFDPNLEWDKQPFYDIDPNSLRLNAAGVPLRTYPGTPLQIDLFDVKLQENQYWVMGDNRLGSDDSRVWGVLDGKLIHGKIIYRIWSMDSNEAWWFVDLLKNPIKFFNKIRWSRCFQFVG